MSNLCKFGHNSARRINGNCIQCEKERYAKNERKREQTKEAARQKREKIRNDPTLKAEHAAYQKQYRLQNKERIAANDAIRQRKLAVEIRLKRKGLNPKQHAETVKEHNGVCDLCGKPGDGRWKSLNIDHCHTTKTFRGILCSNCNRAIGYFSDNPELMRKAADYVEAHRKLLPGENVSA